MKRLRMISGNLAVVSLLVLGMSKILDWYNPFMDFGGHTFFMVYVLAGAAVLFVVSCLKLYLRTKKQTERYRKRERRQDGNKTAAGNI